MDETKTPVKDQTNDSDATSAKTNGEVKSGSVEEQLQDFVVIDELKLSNKEADTAAQPTKTEEKEPAAEVKSNSDESAEKAAIPIKDTEINNKSKEAELNHDGEKNEDSLILTADEDLEPVAVASPKKPNPETTAEVDEAKENATDAALTNSANTETVDNSKAPAEKVSTPKNQRVIWVSNISKTIKATDLKQYLSKAGKVTTAKVVTDGKRCFGYVLMENPSDAAECIKTLNNTNFDGKSILLSFDKPTKVNNASKANDSRSDTKKSTKENSQSVRTSDSKRAEKRRRSSSKSKTDKTKTDAEGKAKKEDSSETTTKPAEKKARSRSRSRDRYIRERNERERLKRRIMEEERKAHEARMRQIEVEERQREKEFRLEQERRKLQMERELFEKQKKEWARINEERRKLERARLEVEQQRAKLEEDLKKERLKRKSPEMMPSVMSKISDPLKKGLKVMKRDDYKNSYDGSAPPPPKLSDGFDHGGRKTDERKMSRIGGRKIEVIDRKFYNETTDRKKHYARKPEFEDNSKPYMKRYPGEREDEHRTQWPSTVAYGSGAGPSAPRYQDAMPSQQFGGAPSRASGYYYHQSTSTQEFPRYDQVSSRKY